MKKYLALLRGVNVGGKAKLPMAELRTSLDNEGLVNVVTYIQSGNVIFESEEKDKKKLAALINKTIKRDFNIDAGVAIFDNKEWAGIISSAPDWWGHIDGWKHNMWVLIDTADLDEVVNAIGELKPDIESVKPGLGVIYQSMSFEKFGRTSTGKIASSPAYKKITIRNYNTSTKLLGLLKA